MNNIVIGQYIPGNSWIYKLDPRIKIVSLVILMVATFLLKSALLMAIMFILMTVMFLTTGIPFMKVIRGLRPLLFLLTFTFFIQVLGTSPTNSKLLFQSSMTIGYASISLIVLLVALYMFLKKYIKLKVIFFFFTVIMIFVVQGLVPYGSIWNYNLNIYLEALINTGFLILRIIIIITLSSLLTFSTMPTDITNGIESLLKPLKVIRFPVGELAMMLSLTLRFIPTLLEETNKIMKAQASRGVEFSESKFKDKISQVISLLIPIFVVSFKRAEDLANAMETRGYIVGAERTKIDLMKMRISDYVAIFLVLSLLTLAILTRVGVIPSAL